jgi:hypothetical protein
MLPVSDYDVVVVVAVSIAIQITGLVFIAWQAHRMGGMLKESQRMTRAVAGLVIQEHEKTRALFRDA